MLFCYLFEGLAVEAYKIPCGALDGIQLLELVGLLDDLPSIAPWLQMAQMLLPLVLGPRRLPSFLAIECLCIIALT